MVANHQQPDVDTNTGDDLVTGRPTQHRKVWRRARPLRRILYGLTLLMLPVLLLGAIGIGVVYVRLSNGPVSLSYLKPAIERQIAEKLGGLNVAVSDVVLSLVGRRAEFRLKQVRVMDEHNVVVAQAPLASMQIDRAALFRAQVVPTGITLIRPRMRLTYSGSEGLSLSFKRTAATRGARDRVAPAARDDEQTFEVARAQAMPPPASGQTVPGEAAGEAPSQITVLRSIAGLLAKMKRGGDSVRSLDRIGVRNALIELEHAGGVSQWGVPSGDLEIRHLADRKVITGLTTVAETEGSNIVMAFHAEALEKSGRIVLRTSIRDLKPSAIARISPSFAGLAQLRSLLSAEAKFDLNSTGDVLSGQATLELGAGFMDMAANGTAPPIRIDHGRVAVRFDRKHAGFQVMPSTVSWGGGNQLVFVGNVMPDQNAAGQTGNWTYDLRAQRGQFVAEADAKVQQPVQRWSMKGRVQVPRQRLQIDEAVVAVAGGSVVFTGEVSGGIFTKFSFDGRIGPGPASALAYTWPATIAPDARDWVRANVVGGQLDGGKFASRWTWPTAASAGMPIEPWTQTLALQGTNVQVISPFTRLPVFAAKTLIRVNDDQLEITSPSASMKVGRLGALRLKQLLLSVPKLTSKQPVGQLSFKASGRLRDAVELLSTYRAGAKIPGNLLATLRGNVHGTIDGRLNLQLPLYSMPDWAPGVTGAMAVRDVRLKDVVGGHDLSGGSFDVNIADKSVNASGEMLIADVATKAAWQYILEAPLQSQPPLRLTASLDEADRQKLGIKINHILRGIVNVELNLVPLANGRFGSKVRADATNATIIVESLAWVKPTGRQTLIEFDLVNGKKYPMLLDNLRVVGDGIAIQGHGMLDASFQLKAFELPTFTIDRVTRLKIRGKLDKANIWHVAVSGQTFEGRALFRSLFRSGRAGRRQIVPDAQQMGVDLEAEVATVLGFWNTRMSQVRMSLSKRRGKIQSMQVEGRLVGNKLLKAAIVRSQNRQRELHAFSSDAGQALTLVGFYPNAQSGRLELVVNLDGQGAADKSGVLLVRDFQIRNDKVVGELTRAPQSGIRRRRTRKSSSDTGQELHFDWMRVPFFIGNGQFILQGAELRGPVVGATIEGKADFEARHLDLSGTYVPLQGLNGAIGVIPGIGQILAGPNGEGILGMKFAVRGPMNRPEMLVNPLSMMAPGIFREIFQISNPSLEVTKRSRPPAASLQPNGQRRNAPKRRLKKDWRSGAFGENGWSPDGEN
jgi:AsmA-like C-terminal region